MCHRSLHKEMKTQRSSSTWAILCQTWWAWTVVEKNDRAKTWVGVVNWGKLRKAWCSDSCQHPFEIGCAFLRVWGGTSQQEGSMTYLPCGEKVTLSSVAPLSSQIPHLKILTMPRCHILEWQVLNPTRGHQPSSNSRLAWACSYHGGRVPGKNGGTKDPVTQPAQIHGMGKWILRLVRRRSLEKHR